MATCTGGRDIRIVSTVRLYLLLKMLVADGNHRTVWSVRTAVDALTLLIYLGAVSLGADEHDITLIDACIVGAAVRSLLIAPSQARA